MSEREHHDDAYEAIERWAVEASSRKSLPPTSDRMSWSDEAKVEFCLAWSDNQTVRYPHIEDAFALNLVEIVEKVSPNLDKLETRISVRYPEDAQERVAAFNEYFGRD